MGGLFGGGDDGAEDAADAQVAASQEAAEAQKYAADIQYKMYQQQRADYQPYYNVGLAALPKFNAMLGLGGGTSTSATGASGGSTSQTAYSLLTPEQKSLYDKYPGVNTTQAWAPLASAPGAASSNVTTPFYIRKADGVYSPVTFDPYKAQVISFEGKSYPSVSAILDTYPYNTASEQIYTNPNYTGLNYSGARDILGTGMIDGYYRGDYWGAPVDSSGGATGLGMVDGHQMTQAEYNQLKAIQDQMSSFVPSSGATTSTGGTNTGGVEESPYAAYVRQQATEAANRQYAARGLGGSGFAASGITDINRAVAADDWQTQYGRILDALKLGTGAAGAMGSASQGYASGMQGVQDNLGSIAMNKGAGQASYLAGQNTGMSGLGGLLGGYAGSALMGSGMLGIPAAAGLTAGTGLAGALGSAAGPVGMIGGALIGNALFG